VLRNLPTPIKIYVALTFLSALAGFWRIFALVAHGTSVSRAAWELIWAVFEVTLGIGLIRFRPWARVIALICCWLVFTVFGIVLLCWCIWPHSVSVAVFAVVAAAAALNLYFYAVLRRTNIRAMFHLASSRPV
jgi:hypothetical protein